MAERKNEFPPSMEANRKLLDFDAYEEYLDSLVDIKDLRNLRSIKSARFIAELGYRSNGDTLAKTEFETDRQAISDIVFPKSCAYISTSEGAKLDEALARELGIRERSNRLGIVQTIVFVRHFTKCGFEISGYIDFGHRLLTENWNLFFKHNKRLWPKDSDLGYYHYRHGTVRVNITRNYKPVMDVRKGLLFLNRHDHKMIAPDPHVDPGENTTKTRIFSSKYTQIEIYDHIVRKKP